MPTLFVGIDVAQANLDVCIQPLGKTLREPVDRFNDLVWPGADVAK